MKESGHSAKKHRELDYLVGMLFRAIGGMINKQAATGQVRLFDLHGGHGTSANVLRLAAHRSRLPFHLWTFEKRRLAIRVLQKYFSDDDSVSVIPGDHHETIGPILTSLATRRPTYGLIFIDPWDDVIPLDVINQILQFPGHERIDVMIHLSATSRKRMMGAGYSRPRLAYELQQIKKRLGFLRIYQGAQQWHFYLATNWKEWPDLKEWIPAESPLGQDLLERLDSTRRELIERR